MIKTDIQYQLKTNKEIQFHLTSFKLSPWIQVKSFSPTTSENYSYVALSSAAEQLEHKSNTYGVVHSILKVKTKNNQFKWIHKFLTCFNILDKGTRNYIQRKSTLNVSVSRSLVL